MKRSLLYFLFAFLFVMVAGLTYHLFVYARTSVAASMIINILVPLSVLLFVVILFVLGRSLFFVLLERRQDRPGSRIKVRLVSAFLFVAFVPSLIIFFLSSRFLDNVLVNMGLDPNIRNLIQSVDQISKDYLVDVERLQMAQAPELWELDQGEEAEARIRAFLLKRRLQGVEFYREGKLRRRVLAPGLEPRLEARILETEGRFSARKPGEDGLLAVRFTQQRGSELMALLYCKDTPFTQKFNFISDSYNYLRQAERKSERVEFLNRGVLLVTTLAVIFGGVWLGLTLSRRLMIGITALIQGAESIARGDYDALIQLERGDEMENVATAFNTMRARLKLSQEELEKRNLDLATANTRLSGQIHYTETLLNRINTGILSLDPDDRILTANPAALRILELEGIAAATPFADLIAGVKHQPLLRIWEEYRQREFRSMQIQQEWRGGEGESSMFVAVSLTPLLEEGERLGSLVVLEDLTQLQNAQKLAAWREVARRIAHEIKNPLTPIQLSIQRVARKARNGSPDLAEVIESAHETIMAETGMLKNLLEEFTTFAKLPAPQKQLLQLDELVRSVVEAYAPAHGNVSIVQRLQVVPRLAFDPNQMRQVLVNLLGNAAAAMPEGGEVVFELESNEEQLELRVCDQGMGVAEEDKEKIFLPYFSKSTKGTGLGLAIVKRIVEDHGGKIFVENNQPHGAVFRLQYPLEKSP